VPLLSAPAPQPGERAIYLHEIQDPGNLGTILRTLAWFGNFRCLLSPNSVDLHNGKAVRASMGAIFHVPVEIDVPFEALPARFARIASLDLHGQPISTPAFREFDCYIYGNEARGLPRDALAGMNVTAFTIAGTGAIESLNVATTVNICQYELTREAGQAR
jgi:RNA methyltransferase, TrmH family